MFKPHASLVCALSFFAVAGGLTPLAQAQQTMRVMSSVGGPGGGGGNTQISSRGLEKYSSLLGLDDTQREAAKSLHEGYVATMKQAATARREAMQALVHPEDEDDDRKEFMQKLRELGEKHTKATEAAEKSFLGDLRALLTPAQEGKWPLVERTRRREVGLQNAMLSGEGVDLVEILDSFKLSPAQQAPLSESVEQYEKELDLELAARAKANENAPKFDFEGGNFDLDKLQDHMKNTRAAAAKVRDLNERHAGKFATLLPEDIREKFNDEVRRASYPRIYKPSKADKHLAAVEGFSDLSPEQRKDLETLRSSHVREAAQLNRQWAAAARESEDKQKTGMFSTGAGIATVSLGDEGDSPEKEPRRARKELDKRTLERLGSILKPEQKEKLPKDEPEHMGGGGVFISRDEEQR